VAAFGLSLGRPAVALVGHDPRQNGTPETSGRCNRRLPRWHGLPQLHLGERHDPQPGGT